MELKRTIAYALSVVVRGFNRTLMELKPLYIGTLDASKGVLIVPLWN